MATKRITQEISVKINADKGNIDQLRKELERLLKLKEEIETGKRKRPSGQTRAALEGNIHNIRGRIQGLEEARREGQKTADAVEKNTDKINKNVEKRLSLMQRASRALGQAFLEAPLYATSFALMNYLNQAFQKYVEIDKILTRIAIVTERNTTEIRSYALYANEAGKALGVTGQAFMEASLIFLQQGGLASDYANQLAEASIKLANITGENRDATSEYITAIANSFKLLESEGSAAGEKIIDVLAALDAASGSSGNEIAAAMKKSASSMAAAGFTMEQTAAMISVISETTRQAPEMIGTGLKTVIGMISEVKKGTKDYTEMTSKLQKVSQQFGVNIDIINRETGDMKEAPVILQEVFDAYNKTNSIAAKNAIIEAVAGKEQRDRFIALAQNQERYNELLGVAEKSKGFASIAQMKYMDSFNAKMEQLNAEMEEFWLALMDDKTLKGFLDQLIGLVGVINELLKGGNAFAKVLTAIATTLLSLKSLKMGTFFGELGAPKKVVDKLPTKPEDVVQLASQTGQGQSGFGARIKSGLVTTGALLTSVQDKHNIRMGIEKEIFTADQAALYEQEKAAGGKDMLIGTGSQDKMIKEIFGADSDQYKEYKSTEMKSKGGIGKEAAFTSIMEREGYAVSPVAGTHPGNINKTFDVTKKGMSDSSKQIDQYVKATKKAQLASSGMAAGLQVAASAMMIFSNNTLTAQEKTKLFAGDMVAGLGTALAPLAGPFAPLVLIGSQLAGMAIKMINVEDATQKARDAMNKFNKETAESYKAQRPAIDDLTRRYAELTHYVELTDVEQQELTEVKNRLAELMPSIVLGYDEYNNAIIQSSDTLQKHIAILREKNKEELLSLKGETIKKGSEEKMGALALKGIETKDTSSSQLLIQDKDGVLTSDSQIKKLFPELSDQQRKDLVGQLNTIAKSEISKEQKTKLYNEVLDRFGVSGDISSELDVFGMPTGLSGFKKTELKDQITEADYGNIQEVAMGQEQNFFATLQTMGKSTSQAQEYTRAYGGLMSALTASPEELAEMGMDKESLNQLATDFATMADDEFFLKYQGQLDNIIQKQKDQEAGIKNDLLFLTEEDRTKLTEEQKTELAELNKNFGESVYDFAEEHGLTLDAAAKEMRAAMLKLPVKEQKEQLKILSDAFADFKIPPEFENAEEAFTSFADGVSGIGARVMKDIPNTGTALSLLTQINLEAAKAAEILGEVMDPKSPGSSLITPAEKKRVEGVISQLKYIKVTYAKTSTSESMAALLDEDGAMNTLSRSSADLLTTATVEFNEEAYQDYLGGLPETPEGPAGPRILEDWEKELILKDLLLEYGEQLNEQEEEQLKILIRQKDLNVEQVKIYKDQLALVKKLRGEQEKSALVLTRTRGGGFAFRYSAKAQEQKQQLKYEEFANLYFQAKDAGVPNDVLMIASGLAVIGKHEEAAQLLMQSKTIKEGEMSKTDMSAVKSDLYNFVSGSSLSQEDKDKLISAYGLTPGASTSAGKVYVVKSGDTLGKIAAAHGTTVNDILKKNPSIKDANKISVGQTIALAKGGLVTGSIFANIGEAGKELVLPLERNTEWMDLFARKLNMAGGSSGQVNVTNYITLPNATSDEIKQILSGMSNTTTQWLNKRRSY